MAEKMTIMLDPGHDYAKYNQSPVVPSYYEGAQMWRLYEFLKPALEKRGFIVKGTKSKADQSISVTDRGRMAKGCDLLISLHSNACDTPSVDRPVGIYLYDDDCGEIDEESKEIAVLLAKVVENVMGTGDKAKTYSKLASGDRDGDGKRNDDYYGVLYGAHQVGVAAIILEHSFHTNAWAAGWLLKDENLKRLAEAEATALAEYYNMTISSDAEESKPVEQWYRVRKSWNDAKSQLGAFRNLEYAKAACPGGYTVYDWDGNPVYSKSQKKTNEQIADEVIAGKWGNGAARKARLKLAGYDPAVIQAIVNKKLLG